MNQKEVSVILISESEAKVSAPAVENRTFWTITQSDDLR